MKSVDSIRRLCSEVFILNCSRIGKLHRLVMWVMMFVVTVEAGDVVGNVSARSTLDDNVLNVELHDVRIKAKPMLPAFHEICSKYLLRLNLYIGTRADAQSDSFHFNRATATGKELIEAFLVVYPVYTYTQDHDSGVIWVHPKTVKYEDILNQKVRVDRPAYQTPAMGAVLLPLCQALAPRIRASPEVFRGVSYFFYGVDIPSGIRTTKEILNICCVANPLVAFMVFPEIDGALIIAPRYLDYLNPLAPPRVMAVRFWELEIGKATKGIPSADEIGLAMCDTNPRKRWAARSYLEAASKNYRWSDLVGNGVDPERALWTALGIEAATFRGINDEGFLLNMGAAVTNNLARLQNPGLALLTCLELAREKQDTGLIEGVFRNHKFSPSEIASIEPDVYRMFHGSELVRDKLKALKLQMPEFSGEALRELEKTNRFTLVPEEKK
jgi:hypothetical protein